MGHSVVETLFLVLFAALLGGVLFHFLRLPSILGYVLVGLVGRILLPNIVGISDVAQFGIILLLFSVGIELSLNKILKFGPGLIVACVLQIVLVTSFCFASFYALGLSPIAALVLAFGFSLSSTAVVVKILEEKVKIETIEGSLMISWLIVQDLAVIPAAVILPTLREGGNLILADSFWAVFKAVGLLVVVYLLGRKIAPLILHKIASLNNRELLMLSSVSLALGVAYLVSAFGISEALGAFLAGLVISETQENHAIFAETRPLRDLFVILFFVSLGMLVDPILLIKYFWVILSLTVLVLATKIIVTYVLCSFLGYKGKTAIWASLGLSQVGEFSFILFMSATAYGILSTDLASIGIFVTLTTIFATPLIFRLIPRINNIFIKQENTLDKHTSITEQIKGHVIVCGVGRVGQWICKALERENIEYVVIDYNHTIVRKSQKKLKAREIIFGNSADPKILDVAGLAHARAVVIAFPDPVAQEDLIAYVQSKNPNIPIIARAHLDEDANKLAILKVTKVVQPEFEAALAMLKQVLHDMGKSKRQIQVSTKALRSSHTKKISK